MKKYSPDELLKLGIIDEEKYELLKDKNFNKKESKLSLNLFFNILAGLLFGLGIIWVIAANWNIIPDWLVLTALICCSAGCSVWLMKWKSKGKNLEVASIIYAAFCIGTIAYIGQYFNVAANTELFLYVCLLIIASISFYSKSVILSNAYLLFGTIYFISVQNFLCNVLHVPATIAKYPIDYWLGLINPIIFAIIPFVYLKWFYDDDQKEIKLFGNLKTKYKRLFIDTFLIVLCWSLLFELENFGELALLGIFLVALTYFKNLNWEYQLTKWISIITLLVVSCTGLETYWSYGRTAIVLGILALIYIIKVKLKFFKDIKEYKNDKTDRLINLNLHEDINILTILFALTVFFLDTACEVIWEVNFGWEVYLVIVVAWAIYSIIDGIKNSRSKEFTFGEFLLVFEIFRFIFAFEDDLMIRGISAIIIAIVILIVNKKTTKKIKMQEKEDKNE